MIFKDIYRKLSSIKTEVQAIREILEYEKNVLAVWSWDPIAAYYRLTVIPQKLPVSSTAMTGGERGQKTAPHNDAETQKILAVRLRRLQERLWDVLETDPGNEDVIHSLSSSMDSLMKRYHSMGINAGKTDGR